MKKFLIVALFAFAINLLTPAIGSAQSTTMRCGSGASYDPSNLNYKKVTLTEVAGNDTVTIVSPNAWQSYVVLSANLIDSCSVKISAVTNCKLGDHIQIMVTNSSGSNHCLKFIGTNLTTSATGTSRLVLASTKTATIVFVFNGVLWVEQSRSIQ
jgi:hypothetical protein